MIDSSFNWRKALGQLFSATVNQQTLEEAAELMVSVSSVDPSYHDECLIALDSAISAAETGDLEVIAAINMSGYKVSNLEEALEILLDFRSVYLSEFNRIKGLMNASFSD